MKWRKASETLPPVGKDCNLKINNVPFSGRYWNSGNENALVPYEHFDVAGKSILSRKNFHIIFWLDESASLPVTGESEAINKAIIEELQSLLSSSVHPEYLPEKINDRIAELKGDKSYT